VKLSRRIRSLIDGRGAERVLAMMVNHDRILDTERLRIRKADQQDTIRLWQMANDPAVRRTSLNPEPISYDRHCEWYTNKLSSQDCRIWVMELNGGVAAQIRYDCVGNSVAEIDYSVAAGFRGKGIGTKALRATCKLACQELGVTLLRGIVLESNGASTKAFRKAGFLEVGERRIQGQNCRILEFDCGSLV